MSTPNIDTYETDAAYFADHSRISASMLKTWLKSRELFHALYVEQSLPPKESTARMELGTAAHAAILQPEDFDKLVVEAPAVDRRTKAGKQQWEEFQQQAGDRIVLTAEQMEQVRGMADSVAQHEMAAELMTASVMSLTEQSITWEDADTGLPCRAKPDLWDFTNGVCVDLKTVSDPSRADFVRAIANHSYGVQMVHYLAGTGCERFVFVAVCVYPPYITHLYELSEQSVERLIGVRQGAMRDLAQCYESGDWQLQQTEVDVIELPAWAT